MTKPFSQACENNKAPILSVLRQYFCEPGVVLEIGSGTGQHGVFFASQLPHLLWQPTDLACNLEGIQLWQEEVRLDNLKAPQVLNIQQEEWPVKTFNYVFTANTAHIMSWPEVQLMFSGIGKRLPSKGLFCIYGPFNYQGDYTSISNQVFDQSLKGRNPKMGIRDFEAIAELAETNQLKLLDDIAMPANNRVLVWEKL